MRSIFSILLCFSSIQSGFIFAMHSPDAGRDDDSTDPCGPNPLHSFMDGPSPVELPSFRDEVMPVLSRSGCNLGTCHGNQNGKGGLKLSLRGQDPDADYVTLTRQLAGRRTSVLTPEDSLLLRKPAMQIPHEGGRRFHPDDAEYMILLRWIAAGMPASQNDAPRVKALSVSPAFHTLSAPERVVSLTVLAMFTDGTTRDVTRLSVFESSDPAVVVTRDGMVEFSDGATARLTTVNVRYQHLQATARLEFVPSRDDFVFDAPAPAGILDELVFSQLRRLKINPSPVCDDHVFLRRVSLDLTGLLPSARKAREFMESSDPDKRRLLIDELLDSQEFVDFQTLRWADLLRVEEKTLDNKGVQVYSRWIRDCVAADKPLNEFASEIVSARGSTYTEGAANFYRALRTPDERSEAVAQVFLGVRLQCAKCHNHPFDRWTQEDYYGWTNYFAQVDYKIIENNRRDINDKHEFVGEQIVLMKGDGNVKNPSTGKDAGLRFLGDVTPVAANRPKGKNGKQDRLQILAAWLADPENDRFAATQANRIWYQLMGTGVVDPIDDFRDTNPPVNPELLDALKSEFIRGGFRVRSLMRRILNSKVYQLSSVPNPTNQHDERLFSRAIPVRLTAEQTLDAISQVLDVTARFAGQPDGIRSVQLPGGPAGSVRRSRPEIGDRFLTLFGKPPRLLTCECERTGETTLAQTMELVSGELISTMLRDDKNIVSTAMRSDQSTAEFIEQLFWTALGRPVTEDERSRIEACVAEHSDRQVALQDLVWAVLNSNEFLLRQ